MKTFYFILCICAALWRGACYANPPGPSPAPPASGHSANSPSGSVHLLPSTDTSKAVVAAKVPLPENKTPGLNSPKAKPLNVIQPAGPVFRDARNRIPATAIVGGPAKSKTAPVINGTAMNHKPL